VVHRLRPDEVALLLKCSGEGNVALMYDARVTQHNNAIAVGGFVRNAALEPKAAAGYEASE
jgi:uncharacterized protein YeaO (DUF488 family)